MEITVSRHFLSWLYDAGISLAFTTYQTNRLFLIGLKPDGALSIFERHFDRPMGLCAASDRLYMSTRWQLWELADALPAGESYQGYDRLFVPRCAYTTGELDVHDVAVDGTGRIVFVNTLYSCLATFSDRYSFTSLWKPPFISGLAPEDRCHLNGLAIAEGEPAYVTAVSRSDVAAGWRDRRHAGGCLIDVSDDEMVTDGLSMPHSPRVYREQLWVLNSGAGEIGSVLRRTGSFEPLAFCPGYLRGLAFWGDHAIVGLSKQRHERTFTGLALDDRLRDKDVDPRCGLWVVDLQNGRVAHWLQIDGVVIELYDVAVIPGARRPMALGFHSDEIQRLITVDTAPRAVFQPLHVAATAPPAPAAGVPSGATAPVRRRDVVAAHTEYQLGNRLAKNGHFAEAIARFDEALRHDPAHVNARVNLGTCRHRLGDVDGALACYLQALAVDACCVRAHANAAALLRERGDIDEAVGHYEAARRVEPSNADILHELGLALYSAGRLLEAKTRLQQAIEASPRLASAHNSLGGVLKLEEKDDEALRCFECAAKLDPRLVEAQENAGKIHEAAGRIAEAREAYGRALRIRDDPVLALHGELLCPPVFQSTEDLDAYWRRAEAVLDAFSDRDLSLPLSRVQSTRAEPPFEWTYHGRDTLPLKRKYARLFERSFPLAPLARRPSAAAPWRVGFVVTPTHEGVFLRCMGGLIDRLDPARFRVTVACARMSHAIVRQGIRRPEVGLVDLPLRFDHAVAQLRAAELDLIYFWEVGTDATNYFLPFCRLAPVQCTGWGWPDTNAAPELDYHLTSAALAPPEADRYFSEKLVRLPSLPPYFPGLPVPAGPAQREGFELPERAHVYLCAQNLRKIHPDLDPLIGGILRADPDGVAVFVHDRHPAAGELLRQRWREHLGDVVDRILLLPRQHPAAYLHLLAAADAILDTLHFTGANTAYDALAVGMPVVTLPTVMPRSRYTAALYQSVGVEDCVAGSPTEYVDIAVRIGTDRTWRAELIERIRAAAPSAFGSPAAVAQLQGFFADAIAHHAQT